MYDALAAAPAKSYGWEAEQFGLAAPVEAGRLYEQLGDTARARRDYETLIARWPTADTNLGLTRMARDGVKRLAVVRR